LVTFTVVATNGVGDGPASAPSASVRVLGAPGVVGGLVATPGNAQATVRWTAPAWDGGSKVTGYTVSVGGKSCAAKANETSCTVTDLANGTRLSGTVVAANANGNGTAVEFAVTPTAAAPKFTSVAAASDVASSSFRFTVDTSATVAATSKSKPWLSVDGLPTGLTFTPGIGTKADTATIGGKTPVGGIYTFTITASNSTGVATVQTFTLRSLGFAASTPASFTTSAGVSSSFTVSAADPLATITSTALPAGLTLRSVNGVATISGRPTVADSTDVTFTATDGTAKVTKTVTLIVNGPPSITVTGTTTKPHRTGSFSLTVNVTGFPDPKVTVTGLPSGMKYSAGKVTGKIATAGKYTFKVTATNGFGTDVETLAVTAS